MDPSPKYVADPPTYEEAIAAPEDVEEDIECRKKQVVNKQPTTFTSSSVVSSQPTHIVATYTTVDGGIGHSVDDTCALCCCLGAWSCPSPSCTCSCCLCDCVDCCDDCGDCCGECGDCCGDICGACGDCDLGGCDCC